MTTEEMNADKDPFNAKEVYKAFFMPSVHEMNHIMAEYMGYTDEKIQCEDWCGCNVAMHNDFTGDIEMCAARYNESFDWLMPVWQKLRGELKPVKTLHDENTSLLRYKSNIENAILDTDITTAHRLMVEAIELIKK